MTHSASKVLGLWGKRKNGHTSFRMIVNRVDPLVEVSSFLGRHVVVYTFFDRSIIITTGQGPHFRVEMFDPPIDEPKYKDFNPDDTTKES